MKKFIFLIFATIALMTPVIGADLTDDFLAALKEDRISSSDSMRCIRVAESEIYYKSSSSMQEYIPLFNYLIGYRTEEYAEGIYRRLYEMFIKFPEKQNEFDDYLMLLPEKEQNEVITVISMWFLSEHLYDLNIYDLWNLSRVIKREDLKKSFWKKFPFLYKYRLSHEEIESYYD